MVHGPTQTKEEMKKKEALIFRVKCIMKKCKEKGKWDLISRLAYKYGIVVAGEKFYD